MAVDFGDRLRARAQELGLSDAEVARRLELSQTRYSNYVNGIREPDYQTLARICGVLQTTPNALLGFETTRAQTPEHIQIDRIHSALSSMSLDVLELIAPAIDAMATESGKRVSKKKRK